MRAVVDDRNLAALNGASPARISMMSWAFGASLAAVAGILIAPILNLEILNLTLLVVVAYAAAVVGTAAYVIGYIASFWLPEPQKADLPD
jgi:branched-chain amino acid transport system permease protein